MWIFLFCIKWVLFHYSIYTRTSGCNLISNILRISNLFNIAHGLNTVWVIYLRKPGNSESSLQLSETCEYQMLLHYHPHSTKIWNSKIHITRLNLVKSAIFQKWFFWCFFIRNDLSRVDLIIKVVLEFLSDL